MYSYPTLREVRSAADDYWQIWQQLLSEAGGLRQAVGQHSPAALGWKVEGDLRHWRRLHGCLSWETACTLAR
jgi:hypothetical protein